MVVSSRNVRIDLCSLFHAHMLGSLFPLERPHFLQRSWPCLQIACREPVQTSYLEISKSELAKRPLIETLHRDSDLANRSYRDLGQRSCQEICSTKVLPRDHLHGCCAGTLYRDLWQRSCEEVLKRSCQFRNLLQRSCVAEILQRDLLKRFCQETLIETLYGDLAQRSCTAILARHLS